MAPVVPVPQHVDKLFPGWHPHAVAPAVLRRLFLAFARAYHPDKLAHADRAATELFQQVSDWYDTALSAASAAGSVRLRWHAAAGDRPGAELAALALVPDPKEPEFAARDVTPSLVEIFPSGQRGVPRKFWRNGLAAFKEVPCALLVQGSDVPFVRCMTAARRNAFDLSLHVRQAGQARERVLLQVHVAVTAAKGGGELAAEGYFVWNWGGKRALRDTHLWCTDVTGVFRAKTLELTDGSTDVRLEQLTPRDPSRGALVCFQDRRSQRARSFWRGEDGGAPRKRVKR